MAWRIKRSLLVLIFIICVSTGSAQSCLPEGIVFTTQSQIDSFSIKYPGCAHIEGSVEIIGDSIHNLLGLDQLDSIGGYLSIGENMIITSLVGLEGLQKVGGRLSIYQNEKLEDISALQELSSIDRLFVADNSSLPNLEGLQNIYTLVDLIVAYNPSLKSLAGLDSLRTVFGAFSITDNDSLENLGGITEITFMGESFNISENASLSELACIINCDTIHGNFRINNNPELININGINDIQIIQGSLGIHNNVSLESIGALLNLRKVGVGINDAIVISGNTSLTSLHGLDSLERCEASLIISSNAISNLSGLENLEYIYTGLDISNNPYLKDLSALNNLSYAIVLSIDNNDSITSLTGLDNIPGSLLQRLSISGNERLSHCNTQTICEYLLDPLWPPWIKENSTGCNSVEEVEDSCNFTLVNEVSLEDQIIMFPIPAKSNITVSYPENVRILTIELYNYAGTEIFCHFEDGKVDISMLASGFYVAMITTDRGIVRKKIIKHL